MVGTSDLKARKVIDLQQPHSLTDTVSDLATDPTTSLLAALLCEQGKVVIVDGQTDELLATADLGPVKTGAGPGRMNAAVDGKRRRVFVYLEDDKKLYRLDEDNGFQPSTSMVVTPDPKARGEYAFKAVYYSPMLDKVMVYDQVIDPDSLEVDSALPQVQRVIAEHEGAIYTERHDPASGDIMLMVWDASTWEPLGSMVVGNYQAMGAYLAFDFERKRVAAALSAKSEIHFEQLDL